MLKSFADRDTEGVWSRQWVRRFHPDLRRLALHKPMSLDAAEMLSDLRVPPGDGLERLGGDPSGQHSIRVNDQSWIWFR